MTDFLNPPIWEAGKTAYSAENLNGISLGTANDRVLADYTAIAVSQPADLGAFVSRMKRYSVSVDAWITMNTDYTLRFPDSVKKDNTDYGVSIVYRPTNRNESELGWSGDIKNGKSLQVVKRNLDSVTVRYQTSDGPSVLHVLVSCVGGVEF